MIDRDLAELYGVPTWRLNEQVKRNIRRFPEGFMFRLNRGEALELIANCDRFAMLKHSSVMPLAFTEHGIAMLSSVLRSKRAIQINIRIIQAFIRLREMALAHKELAAKLAELERKVGGHDRQIEILFQAMCELVEPQEKPKPVIGFRP
ncbi:MAG TPA: ORF6N domain-containing protein [Elusimicrobiota bacterium]|nr:ORF6N domain-containing protein [Elusimicrobiota bacterium]